MQKLITLENVSYKYAVRKGMLKLSYFESLKNISFEICKGETIGIVGANGAGKSTLLRLIAGITEPSAGQIFRHCPASVSLLTLQIGFSNELSGRDNAILGAMLLGSSYRQAKASLESIKTFAELGRWFDEPLKTYSSGMRARLGFAVAMKMTPDVLLVDEVLGVGDQSFREKSTIAMKEKMLSGQTVLFVSHNANMVKELCSSVVWIEEGVVRMFGKTESVLSSYLQSLRCKGVQI